MDLSNSTDTEIQTVNCLICDGGGDIDSSVSNNVSLKCQSESDLQTLAKLISYPQSILITGRDSDSGTILGLEEQLNLATIEICDICQGGGGDTQGIQDLGFILTQLEELHRQIIRYQEQLTLQIQAILERRSTSGSGSDYKPEVGRNHVDGVRRRILDELNSKHRRQDQDHEVPTVTAAWSPWSKQRFEHRPRNSRHPVVKLRRIDDLTCLPRSEDTNETADLIPTRYLDIEIKQELIEVIEDNYQVEGSAILEDDDDDDHPYQPTSLSSKDSGSDLDSDSVNDEEEPEPKKLIRKRGRPPKKKVEIPLKAKLAKANRKRCPSPSVPNTCPYCGKLCTIYTYKNHVATHTKPFKFSVAECQARFSSPRDLRGHCIKVHPELGVPGFQCPHCPFTTNFNFTLKMHVKWKHEQDTNIACPEPECAFRAPNLHYLKKHVENMHKGKNFKQLYNLEEAKRREPAPRSGRPRIGAAAKQDSGVGDFGRVPKSAKKGTRKRNRDRPKIVVPESGICSFCGKQCTSTTYANHVATHTRPFKCTVAECGLGFSCPRGLRGHCIKVHPELGVPGFLCPHCPFTTNFSETLKMHVRNKHDTENKFACKVDGCDYRATLLYHMKTHVARVHEGRRDFLCTECGLGFFTQHQLSQHARAKGHTASGMDDGDDGGDGGNPKDRTFVCMICAKAFWRKDHLEYHEQTHKSPHQRERPHVCPLCGVRFPVKDNLSRHIRRWHKGGKEHVGERPKRKSPLDVSGDDYGNQPPDPHSGLQPFNLFTSH